MNKSFTMAYRKDDKFRVEQGVCFASKKMERTRIEKGRLSSTWMLMCLLFSVFATLTLSTQAQSASLGGAKGRVINGYSSQPVVGAEIVATSRSNIESEQRYLKYKTKSGKDGAFTIQGLRGKIYTLSVTAKGYLPQRYQNSVEIPERSNVLMDPITIYPFPSDQFQLSEFTIKDRLSGLMWSRNIGDNRWQGPWKDVPQFVARTNEVKYGGYDDWRVPNTFEVQNFCMNIRRTAANFYSKEGLDHAPADFLEWIGVKNVYQNSWATSVPEKPFDGMYSYAVRMDSYWPCEITEQIANNTIPVWLVRTDHGPAK